MRTAMKTHFFLMSTVAVLGTSLLATSYAASNSEYIHLTRHRDSNGNLLMAPTQHKAEPSVMQKTVMPSQPKTFERRSTDWGMSVQEVKDNEPVQSSWDLQAPVLADYEQRIAYHTQIEGIEASLTYSFYENHLGQAKYVFEPQHDDAVEFVQDFNAVKNWIRQTYGEPIAVQEIWLDKLYQYDSSLWGQAVMRGHLVMVAEWKNPGTDIVLMLDGGDDTVGLVADFSSTTFVVPVSFDTQRPEEHVETAIEEHTIQEALPVEPTENSVDQSLAVQDSSPEHHKGKVEANTETELASKGPANEIQDLEEIEQLLNEEAPPAKLEEPVANVGSVEADVKDVQSEEAMIEPVPDTHASKNSEAVQHDILDEHPIDEQHLVGEGTLDKGIEQDGRIEPSVNPQEPEHPTEIDMSELMPLEPSANESTAAVQHMEEHVVESQVQENAIDTSDAMPVEAAPQEPRAAGRQVEQHVVESAEAVTEESTTVVHEAEDHVVEHAVETQVQEQTMDVSEAMPAEAVAEEPTTVMHEADEHVVEHAVEEHANVHAVDMEVEPQHHL